MIVPRIETVTKDRRCLEWELRVLGTKGVALMVMERVTVKLTEYLQYLRRSEWQKLSWGLGRMG